MPLFLKVKCLKVKIHDYERKEEGKLNSFNNLEQELTNGYQYFTYNYRPKICTYLNNRLMKK